MEGGVANTSAEAEEEAPHPIGAVKPFRSADYLVKVGRKMVGSGAELLVLLARPSWMGRLFPSLIRAILSTPGEFTKGARPSCTAKTQRVTRNTPRKFPNIGESLEILNIPLLPITQWTSQTSAGRAW
tara:strand:- start:661 stop:1044 length:384 start_codon:yes stop_codon:yes gene_type:complete